MAPRPRQAPHAGPLQVHELLARMACHHQILARYFHELSTVREDPIASFASLARWRHASVAANLERYASEGVGRELDSWLREIPDACVVDLVGGPPNFDAGIEEFIDYALAIEAALERVYKQLLAHAQIAGLQEMITNLATLEHSVAMRINSARLELGYG